MTIMTTMTGVTETQEAEVTAVATVVRPGEAAVHQLGETLIETLLDGRRAGAGFDVIGGTVPPGAGPPPHIHRREDEVAYVVEGDFEYIVGEQVVRASAGTCLF